MKLIAGGSGQWVVANETSPSRRIAILNFPSVVGFILLLDANHCRYHAISSSWVTVA